MRRSTGFLLLLPSLLVIGTLTLYPVVYNVWLSLLNKHAFLPGEKFVGLRNYELVLKDPQFWMSFKLGVIYSLVTVVLQLVIGIGAALLLHESFPGRNFFRGAILFPYLVPTIVGVLLWKWLLHDTYGLVNYTLQALNLIKDPIGWFGQDTIMISLILVSVWQFFPFVFLTILARLQIIPPELYEAAKVDGASALQRFFYITLPQLKTVLFIIILLRGIWMFTKFDTVWLMGGGEGVGLYIRTLPLYAYMKTFTYWQAGIGATVAMVMLLIMAGAAAIYFKIYKVEEGI
ncbi:MAG TPA: sugar ABC transporter permease [Candidatus Limnocylindrales bacterium]|nr:sugar ABC transporter permease [Candidatus Limnocylindrales bacterium]